MNLSELMIGTNPTMTDLGLVVLRTVIGVCFVIHAMGKLGLVGPGNMEGFASWLESLGVPAPQLQARVAMLSEMVGGILLTLGLLTRPAAALLFFTMMVASTIGHKGGGYLITNDPPGNEYTLNLAAIMVLFFLLGPGSYSLDFVIFGS